MINIHITKCQSEYCKLNRGFTDILKLFAALIICLSHFFQSTLVRGEIKVFYRIFCFQAGYLGVAIFLFLSGYGLSVSWNKNPQIVFNKLVYRF